MNSSLLQSDVEVRQGELYSKGSSKPLRSLSISIIRHAAYAVVRTCFEAL